MIPTLKIEELGEFQIARDDFLPGGTKRRALLRWLPGLERDHFIYAGSVYGSGGWALAEACRDLGLECTLALSKSDYRPEWLDLIDCKIEWHEPQPVQSIYDRYTQHPGLLPLGFDDIDFKNRLAEVFREVKAPFSEVWMPCVSGVLIRAAQLAWPAISINAVCVARHYGDIGNANVYQAPEKYHQPAKDPPLYPANAFSDAKLWQFIRQFALKDALVWNTSI